MEENELKITVIKNGTSPTIIGIYVAGILFVICLVATIFYCYRQKYKKSNSDHSIIFHSHRKPTAVKSPAGINSHYLKKSPSPTGGNYKSDVLSQIVNPLEDNITNKQTKECMGKENDIIFYNEDEINCNENKSLQQSKNYLGEIVFKLRYKQEKNSFIVSIVRCRNLPAKDVNLGTSDPYIKLQLLPDKQHKVKTRVLRKTCNPVYDEDFTFYGISLNQLSNTTLHFVILSFDRYSRDDIIGEVFCSLNTVDLSQIENQQIALSYEIQPRNLKIRSQGRGELLLSLCWQPAANRLTVVILKARNLPKMDVTGLADPYVKIYLLYNGQRIAKKKTHVKKRTLNPVFNESFVFDIPSGAEGLNDISLEFSLLDWDRVTKNEVIGRLEMGNVKCTGSALNHWKEVCSSARRQIADWHKLKE